MARYEEHPVKPTTAVIVLVLSFLFLYCPWLLGSKELYWEEVNYAIQAVENTWFPPLSIEQAVAVANGFPLYPLMARLLYELGIPMELALRLLSIASLDRAEDVVLGSEMTGIFFPAYCMGIPHIMEQFLARVVPQENGNGGKYIYAVCTSGINPGGALPMIEDTLAEKKINLNACFHIRMPSNYIPLSNPPDEKQQAALFAKADRAIRIAVVAVKKRRKTRPLRVFPIDTFMKFVSKRAVATLEASDKFFWAADTCDGCGLCSRICPASNVSLDREERPVWHHHCEQCMACLQWCP